MWRCLQLSEAIDNSSPSKAISNRGKLSGSGPEDQPRWSRT